MSYIPSNGIYNGTPPTLNDGQTYPPALDVNGKLLISPTITLSSTVNPGTYAVDDSAMPATPNTFPMSGEYRSSSTTYSDGDVTVLQTDISGFAKTREQYIPSYEDNTNSVANVEHKYTGTRVTADGQIKGAAGFVHTVSIAPTTASPTAGLLTIYDNTAESGTIKYSEWIFATTPGHTVILDMTFGTGIYVGYDSTLANVSCSVSFR